jgi:hypothetical protein
MINNEHTNNSYAIRREIENSNKNEQIENTLKNISKLCTNIKELTPKDFMECAIKLINSLPHMGRDTALKIATDLYSILEYLPEYEIDYILGLSGDKYGEVKYKLFNSLIYPSKQTIKMFVEYNKAQEQDK